MTDKNVSQHKPDLAAAHFDQGQKLAALHKHKEAIKEFEKAIELRPDWSNVYIHCAASLIASTSFNEAIAKCQKAIQHDGNSADAYRMWGLALAGLKKHEEA